MNLPRQLDKLKEIARTPHTHMTPALLHAALQSPVFIWSPAEDGRQLSEAEQEFVQNYLHDGGNACPTVAPFPAFRISRPDCFDQWFHFPDHAWRLIRCTPADAAAPEQWWINDYGVRRSTADSDRAQCYRIFENGRCCTPRLPRTAKGEPTESVSKTMGELPLNTLSYFLFELFLPNSVTLRVSPPPTPGKSVEWHLSRTHYLLLTRTQAEHCRTARSTPTAQQLSRAAHWRRAHFRRLRSDKFVHKKGQRVPVSQAWIGPEEWVGLDKKIYQVVHLPPHSP